jgi:two-component system, OmpR family, sensor kinase
MPHSLRARLWWSYALVISLVIIVIALGLVFALVQNPHLLYPEAVIRLRLAGEAVPDQIEQVLVNTPQRVERVLQRAAELRQVRAVLLDPQNQVLSDTGGVELPFTRLVTRALLRQQTPDQVRITRAGLADWWLYSVRTFPSGHTLILLLDAPKLRTVFREQFLSTFLWAGLLALFVSVLLALAMGRWIASPLARMVAASRAVARGENPSVPVEGPVEVQELAHALNEMSQRVQNSQQSQRDFVANVSHELKTPLTSIQGFSQAILDGAVQTPDALQQAATVIYTEANRMHRLVLDLLSLARLEAGTADLQHAPVNLDLLLRSVVEKFNPQVGAAQINLTCQAESLPTLTGDGDRLAQVFTNLVDNAIKYTPPGGSVTVRAVQVEHSAEITVIDSGKGIAAKDQARIFDRFYQVDKARKGGGGRGVGLGLAIARQIVLAHGGKIWVESQPGQGSRFVVKIPLTKADTSTLVSKAKTKR